MLIVAAAAFIGALFAASALRKKFGPLAPLCCFVLATLLCEIFVFNFETFRSMGYDHNVSYTVAPSANVTSSASGYVFTSSSDYLQFSDFDGKAQSVYLLTDSPYTAVKFWISDEGYQTRYSAGTTYISSYSPQSSYIRLNTSGDATCVRIYFSNLEEGDSITVQAAGINRQRGLYVSPWRMLIMLALFIFIYYTLIERGLWHISFSDSKKQRIASISAACVTAILFLTIALSNPKYVTPSWSHHQQYYKLAQSFAEGRVDIDGSGADILSEMENPYDRSARNEAFEGTGKSAPWDTAYYNGKFYVYFGVLPVILFYLPYYLMTGEAFPNFLGVVFFVWLLIAAVFLLYRQIVKRYFPHTPFLLYILLCEATLFTGAVYMVKSPDFYTSPIAGGVACCTMGLFFWLRALDGEKLKRPSLFLGSLFNAAVILLRPQLVLISCAAFVIFWNSVFKDREMLSINSRLSKEKYRGLKNTLLFCAPYVVIGIIAMSYNAARFDSPFSFGSEYNLTVADMTRRGFEITRWNSGVFEYLFRPPTITGIFPFLSRSSVSSTYIGSGYSESLYGGLFIVCPLLWGYLVTYRTKKSKMFPLSLFLGAAALVICLLDIQAGGILPRYTSDFATFFAIGAVLVILAFYRRSPEITRKFVAVSFLLIAAYSFFLIFVDGQTTLQTANPALLAAASDIFAPLC
ncbi:MAG: hypothetical protein LUG52_03320 [Clostridia bacterium]|nr:hypothetical protein [Clostridia bacterium]